MSQHSGISASGRSAESLFREATGATLPIRTSDGDALLEGHLVEVKQATRTTINQVRAVKYLPIAIYYTPAGDWYVVPAHVVVAFVSRKERGQHTENPFESATLNLATLARWRVAEPAELRSATLAAIEASARYPALKQAMEQVRRRARTLADESLADVRALVHRLGIEP